MVRREGDLVAGRYRLGALVGSGGTSDVRAATDLVLHRAVAVKLGRAGESDGLLEQARHGARLDHPHVVHVLDAGTYEERPFVVLDLVDGPTLAEVVASGALPLADVLTIAQGVLAGLAHAHARGVLHLDLSTANVVLPWADDGTPDPSAAVVLDLGAVRRADRTDGLVAVTPQYAAPEIASGRPGDERSDVYSAGVLLHELATGHPPFAGEGADARAVLRAHVQQVPAPPSTRVPGLPSAFDRMVARALAKDPADRHADADALLDDVLRLAGSVTTVSEGVASRRSVGNAEPAAGRTTRQLVPVAPAAAPIAETMAARGARAATAPAEHVGVMTPRGASGPVWIAALGAVLAVAVVVVMVSSALGAGDAPGPGAKPVAALTTPSASPSPATTSPPSSRAPTVVTLPTLLGLTLDAARAALDGVGLRLGAVREADGPSPGGVVVAVTPADGEVSLGSQIDLVLASGYTLVPEVAGLGAAAANATLRESGLAVTELPAVGGSVGIAMRTAPQVGERLSVGSAVVLLVGAAPEVLPTPSPTPTPSGTDDPSATPSPPGVDP
ncbi:protein kinase domain-containing protein [Cellulomonas sp.]|uniref:serine/threonine-protein kinase n=1 Tax=Cellulomonas sp. TaxID=40001 RepID=UPI003BA85D6A